MDDPDVTYENAERKCNQSKNDYDVAVAKAADLEARAPDAEAMLDVKKQAIVRGVVEGAGHPSYQATLVLVYAKAAFKVAMGLEAYRARFNEHSFERLSWFRMPEEVTDWVPVGFGSL